MICFEVAFYLPHKDCTTKQTEIHLVCTLSRRWSFKCIGFAVGVGGVQELKCTLHKDKTSVPSCCGTGLTELTRVVVSLHDLF